MEQIINIFENITYIPLVFIQVVLFRFIISTSTYDRIRKGYIINQYSIISEKVTEFNFPFFLRLIFGILCILLYIIMLVFIFLIEKTWLNIVIIGIETIILLFLIILSIIGFFEDRNIVYHLNKFEKNILTKIMNTSNIMCKIALLRNPLRLEYIENQTEILCLYALSIFYKKYDNIYYNINKENDILKLINIIKIKSLKVNDFIIENWPLQFQKKVENDSFLTEEEKIKLEINVAKAKNEILEKIEHNKKKDLKLGFSWICIQCRYENSLFSKKCLKCNKIRIK